MFTVRNLRALNARGDWLDRFGAILGDRGRLAEPQFVLPGPPPCIHYPERLLDHALDFPNAVWRLHQVSAAWTRCLLLAFRYTAVSDEKREGPVWLGTLAGSAGESAESDRMREMLRIATIEREYAAKLGDLRHNYALRVNVEWVQGLELFVPVQRFEVLVKRRKGEKLMRLDWHPAVRLMEPPPSDWGLGIGRSRLVCDDHLHITDPAGQSACPSCGRARCRACHLMACRRCGHAVT
jgi:hypothetical protein